MKSERESRSAYYQRKIVELGRPEDELGRVRLLIYDLLLRRSPSQDSERR